MPATAPASTAASDKPSDSATDALQSPAAKEASDTGAADERSASVAQNPEEPSSPALAHSDESPNDKVGEEEASAKEEAAKSAVETGPDKEIDEEEADADVESGDNADDDYDEDEDEDEEDEDEEEEDDDDDLSSLEGDVLSSPEIDLDLPIQIHSRPDTPLLPLILSLPGPIIDEDTGDMDDSVERHFLNEAEELGVAVPPKPSTLPEPLSRNSELITIALDSPGAQTTQSRASESTRPTSRGSSIHNAKILAKPPTTVSSEPPPIPAQHAQVRKPPPVHINRPPMALPGEKAPPDEGGSRLVKGLKRFSSYTKRRTMMLNKTIPVSSETSLTSTVAASEKTSSSTEAAASKGDIVELDADAAASQRPGSATTAASMMSRKPETNGLPSLHETSSFLSNSPRSPTHTSGGESIHPDEMKEHGLAEAKQRSLRNRHLQAIRLHQLDEQSQFLEYYFGVIDKVRAKYTTERNAARLDFEEQKGLLEQRYDEQHHEMEERHLAKEFDLRNALDQERQACETKLKHMDAYCNGRQEENDESLPRRKVTEEDYRALLHQYHVRQTMGGLHESRINVLRERQAKQLERLDDGHAEELDVLQERFDNDEEQRQAAQNNEEDKIKKEFDIKKHRLIWRWKLMETVERRKLELEMGEVYGELPEVQWGEDELIAAAL